MLIFLNISSSLELVFKSKSIYLQYITHIFTLFLSFFIPISFKTQYPKKILIGMTTSGHSGRYWATIQDTLISGSFEQWDFEQTQFSVKYQVGDTITHNKVS